MASTAGHSPNPEIGPDQGPGLNLVKNDGPSEGAFFDLDPSLLPPVAEVDLMQFRISAMDSYKERGSKQFDPTEVAVYITGAACGNTLKDSIEDKLSKALGVYMRAIADQGQNGALNVLLLENYDAINEQHPRLMSLLDRLKNEAILPIEQFVAVNKLCMLIAIVN